MPKKIQIISGVPGKTLGDLLAAKKLIDKLANEDVLIEWIINRYELISGEVQLHDIINFTIPSNVQIKYVDSWKKIEAVSSRDIDLYMIYPQIPQTPHNEFHAGLDVVKLLENIPQDKILLSCTEYNADYANIQRHLSLQHYYPIVQRLDTGFNELGIFLDSANRSDSLLKNFQESAPEIMKNLFSNQSEENYFAHNHLYIGYYNVSHEKVNAEHNKVDRINYAVTCIRDALYQNKMNGGRKGIDIIIDLDEGDAQLQAILNKLTPEERDALADIKYISKNDPVKLTHHSGNGSINLRIINPFPMPHAAMLYLIAKSNPLTMLTGDQSFTEGLIYSKLIFYQIMHWKKNFFDAFLLEIKKFSDENNLHGDNAILYQFYALQKEAATKELFWDQALKMYHANYKQLLEQQEKFAQYLQQNSNLNNKFVPKVMEVLNMDPLLKACALGDLRAINEYISNNKNINESHDTFGNTPLMLALKNHHIHCIQKLIDAGASLVLRNQAGDTPLMIAQKYKSIEGVKVLLINHAPLDKKLLDFAYNYALRVYTKEHIDKNDMKIAYLIIEHDYKNQLLNLFPTPSLEAILEVNRNSITAPIVNNDSLFEMAAKANRSDLILILSQNLDQIPEDIIVGAFMHAVRMGHIETVRVMLKHIPQIDFLKKTTQLDESILDLAVKFGHKEIAEIFCVMDPALIVKANDDTPLAKAVTNNDIEMVKMLLAFCPDKNNQLLRKHGNHRDSLLDIAARHHYPELVELLLNESANANHKNFSTHALENWLDSKHELYSNTFDLKIPKLLIKHGAELSEKQFQKVIDYTSFGGSESESWKALKTYLADVRKLQRTNELLNSPEDLRNYIRQKVNQATMSRYMQTNKNENVEIKQGVLGFFNKNNEKKRDKKLLVLANNPFADLKEILKYLIGIFNATSSYDQYPFKSSLEKEFDEPVRNAIKNLNDSDMARFNVPELSSSKSPKK